MYVFYVFGVSYTVHLKIVHFFGLQNLKYTPIAQGLSFSLGSKFKL